MKLIDTRFLYCIWDDALIGKKVFAHDNATELIHRLKENDEIDDMKVTIVKRSSISTIPFVVQRGINTYDYTFVYYDPLFKYKQAYEKGYRVMYRKDKGSWLKVTEDHNWDATDYSYTIDRSKLITHIGLTEWCAKGNGVWRQKGTKTSWPYHTCSEEYENDKAENIEVRKWRDTQWHEPTMDYCFPECKSPTPDEEGG